MKKIAKIPPIKIYLETDKDQHMKDNKIKIKVKLKAKANMMIAME